MADARSIITLTTDFGQKDGYVASVKAAVLAICPEARLVDVSHDIEPFDIHSAAWILASVAPVFPKHTIHVAVVDPGVGGDRRPIALTSELGIFIGPDNGIFSSMFKLRSDWHAFELNDRQFWRTDISHTFHARDIFAPVAAFIASGTSVQRVGKAVPVGELKKLPLSDCRLTPESIEGEVVYIDHFGNCITNIPSALIKQLIANSDQDKLMCFVSGQQVGTLKTSYGQISGVVDRELTPVQSSSAASAVRPSVNSVAPIIASHGYLELACNQGRAEEVLATQLGAKVVLRRNSI